MDKIKAIKFAEDELSKFKLKKYSELAGLIDVTESTKHDFNDGSFYQTQMQIFWDDPKEKKDIPKSRFRA